MSEVLAKNEKALRRLVQAESTERGHNDALTDHCDNMASVAQHVMGRASTLYSELDEPDARDRAGGLYTKAGLHRTLAHTLRGILAAQRRRLGNGSDG